MKKSRDVDKCAKELMNKSVTEAELDDRYTWGTVKKAMFKLDPLLASILLGEAGELDGRKRKN